MGIASVALVAGMLHDRYSDGRVHRAYWTGIIVCVSTEILFLALPHTAIGQAYLRALAGIGGHLARWSWIHNRIFRITHLVAIGIVVLQAWFGQLCPLTVWENELRRRPGSSAARASKRRSLHSV